jgi:tRNA threonylcarbamoyl adenosine modification protein YjeE
MADPICTVHLADEGQTDRLAACLAPHLRAGDTILLSGAIGAGKTAFCRALIRARLGREEDVPSPTFTLVQTYDADVEIWHADLYRLTHPDEARELGLEEAFDQAICLVEWPDRLGSHTPSGAITLTLTPSGEGRLAKIGFGKRPDLLAPVQAAFPDRAQACQTLMQHVGWQMAKRSALTGDASTRRYERLALNGETRILMDQPPGPGDDVGAFVHIDRHLRAIGLNAPMIFAEDQAQGFLLLEDFGDDVFARVMEVEEQTPLYRAAVDVLVHIEQNPPAPGIPDLTNAEWAGAAGLVLDWYCRGITGQQAEAGAFSAVLQDVLDRHANGPKVMILRDYHSENLMWLPGREGLQKVGILDFQLAQMGQRGYDLVSLLQDARRDVPPEVEQAMIRHYLDATGAPEAAFMATYAALGAQRALRILGIFARLCLADGKPGYLDLIPRVWQQLHRNLAHPALTALRQICERLLPEPSVENLNRIRVQCGSFR